MVIYSNRVQLSAINRGAGPVCAATIKGQEAELRSAKIKARWAKEKGDAEAGRSTSLGCLKRPDRIAGSSFPALELQKVQVFFGFLTSRFRTQFFRRELTTQSRPSAAIPSRSSSSLADV